MSRNIVKTIDTIDDLDIQTFENLNIGVEIQDFTESNLSIEYIDEIIIRYKERLKDFSGIKALHGPFLDLKPASPDKLIRKVSYNRYLYTMKAAIELNVDYLIFHSQINPYLNQPKLKIINNRMNREFWIEILKEVPNYKGIILLENIFEETPQMLKELIETIDLPNIKINLDIGHANLGKVSLEEWIEGLESYIKYIHIHSNNGIYDEHNIPNDEEIHNLYYLLDKYNINPILSLEYKIDDLKEEIKRYR